jgi:hypothetical protein
MEQLLSYLENKTFCDWLMLSYFSPPPSCYAIWKMEYEKKLTTIIGIGRPFLSSSSSSSAIRSITFVGDKYTQVKIHKQTI